MTEKGSNAMEIKCGNCGRGIVVPEGIATGQHMRCPHCNEKTEFGKPKLGIRRPAQPATRDHERMNAAAAAVDARVRTAERKRRIARLKKSLGNWLSILVLFSLAWGGYVVWKAVQKKELPAQLPESVKQLVSNVIEKVNTEVSK